MGKETERKFKVIGDGYRNAKTIVEVKQGFLNSMPQRTVRVRVVNFVTEDKKHAALTIKGKGTLTRQEYEYEIPVSDGLELLHLCEPGLIEKTRYVFTATDGHTWEVDDFTGENAGLVIAEIELSSENEAFDRPDWLGDEVTGEKRYYNANLIAHPYSSWSEAERR